MAKVAFITGATRGIGKQIAIEFAKDGYDIAFNYRKENEDLENIKKQIKELNVRCLPVKGDVSIFEDTANMVNQIINEFGKIKYPELSYLDRQGAVKKDLNNIIPELRKNLNL